MEKSTSDSMERGTTPKRYVMDVYVMDVYVSSEI
jgi:hypothetical protein